MDGELFGNPLYTAIALGIGGGAGIFFFGTLRIITKKIGEMKNPGAVVLLSLFGRMIPTVAAAYLSARLAGFGGVLFFITGFIGVKLFFILRHRKGEGTAG